MKKLSVLAAVVLVALMVHAWGGFAVRVSPLVSCEPDCTGMNDGDKVVDPKNCSAYSYCLGGEAYGSIGCPPANHFDPESLECQSGAECDSICGPGSSDCLVTCNGTLSGIVDPIDCNVYYFCIPSGISPPQECPDDRPYFDGNSFACVNDASVCCTPYCDPYCDGSGFSVVPDPKDCTSFYICDTVEGVPGDDVHFQCSSGEYFSVQLGACVNGTPPDPCILCDSEGGSTTTTPGGGGDGTTTTATTTTTTTTTDIDGCVSSLVCTTEGNFPACSDCQPEYFQCSGEGAMGVLDSCTDDTVFNPTPGYPYCILPSNCPYP